MKREAYIFENLLNAWLKANAKRIYHGDYRPQEMIMFFHIFTYKDVSKITGREESTVRHARKNGSLFGIKKNGRFYFNIWDIKKCFPIKCRINKKWTDAEIHELIITGSCKTRSKQACKTMRSKLRNGVR